MRPGRYQLADGLGGIGVKKDAPIPAQLADLANILYYAGLIVYVHDGHELRLVTNGGSDVVKLQKTIIRRLQPRHFETVSLKRSERIDHRFVFGPHRNQVLATMRARTRRALNGEIVRLSGT